MDSEPNLSYELELTNLYLDVLPQRDTESHKSCKALWFEIII